MNLMGMNTCKPRFWTGMSLHVDVLHTGETKADQENTDVFPVLQFQGVHFVVYGRCGARSGHPACWLDCPVRPSRWPQGQDQFCSRECNSVLSMFRNMTISFFFSIMRTWGGSIDMRIQVEVVSQMKSFYSTLICDLDGLELIHVAIIMIVVWNDL